MSRKARPEGRKIADLEREVGAIEQTLAFLQTCLRGAEEKYAVAEGKVQEQRVRIAELESLLEEEREKNRRLGQGSKESFEDQTSQKKLHLKIQELCYRYLNYKTKKDAELFEVRQSLESAVQFIRENL